MGFEYRNEDGSYVYARNFGETGAEDDYSVRLREKSYPHEQLGEVVISYQTMGGGEQDALKLSWSEVDAMIAAIQDLRNRAGKVK